jgi:hypothetical protein
MDKQAVLRKFMQILADVPLVQQRKLAKELAKIIPPKPESVFDWRANWAYDYDRQLVQAKFQVKVLAYTPRTIAPLDVLLPQFLATALPLTTSGEALEKLALEGISPYELTCWKVAFLPDKTAFLRFSLSARLDPAKQTLPEPAIAYAR